MKRFVITSLILPSLIFLFNSCSKDEPVASNSSSERKFYMGFTPFPYDVTSQAVNYVYDKLETEADIIAHHFDDGIPWQEALDSTEFNPNIIADWQYRLSRTPGSHKKYVAVTPININRNGLAPYKAESGNLPLPAPWDTISFNHTDVKLAFLNYCKRTTDFFHPDYLVIGIEVNLLMKLRPDLWDAYLDLHKYVYQHLKAVYPDLPVFVSFSGMDLLPEYSDADPGKQQQALSDILPYSDMFGISIYPYISSLLTDSIPGNLFDRIFSNSTKPIAICETGYEADTISVNGGTVIINGTPELQNNYISILLNKADEYDLVFVINFVLRDYDALWESIGSPDDFRILWKDAGLYDENGNSRIAQKTWMQWLNK